jgi:hypothetical protein
MVCEPCTGFNFSSLCNSTHDSICISTCPRSWNLDQSTGLCSGCAPGYTVQAGVYECMQCPANHYCPGDNVDVMKACPPNSTSLPGSTIGTDCVCSRYGGYEGNIPFSSLFIVLSNNPNEPEIGNALGLVGCLKCRAGKYAGPSNNHSVCKACPLGTYSDAGADQCIVCSTDTPYTYAAGTDSAAGCHECQLGKRDSILRFCAFLCVIAY